MTTKDDARTVRLTQAREQLATLDPWLPHVSGAARQRFPELLLGDTKIDVNAPLALVEVEVQAQLRLLLRLRDAGLLTVPAPPEPIDYDDPAQLLQTLRRWIADARRVELRLVDQLAHQADQEATP